MSTSTVSYFIRPIPVTQILLIFFELTFSDILQWHFRIWFLIVVWNIIHVQCLKPLAL